MHYFNTTCEKGKLKDIRQFIHNVMSHYSENSTDITKITLAIDEVCTNLIVHSDNKSEDKLEISVIEVEHDVLQFKITDYGKVYDYSSYKEPSLSEIIVERKKGGIGMMLIRNIMDKVEFKCDNNRNICEMTKKITKEQI